MADVQTIEQRIQEKAEQAQKAAEKHAAEVIHAAVSRVFAMPFGYYTAPELVRVFVKQIFTVPNETEDLATKEAFYVARHESIEKRCNTEREALLETVEKIEEFLLKHEEG